MAGQNDPHISLFSPQEVAFMAEDELAEIVPNMNMEPLNFITIISPGDFGRFVPQIPTQVPMWLAVALKRRGNCIFRPPGWLSVDNLTQVLEAERESQSTFQALQFSYVEIARLLFDQLSYKPLIYDINTTDLYIPLMAFGTYVVLAGLSLGLYGKFTPEALNWLFVKGKVGWFLQVMLLKITLLSLASGEAPLLDIVASSLCGS